MNAMLATMRQFTIKTRMIGAIVIVLTLLCLVGATGLWGMSKHEQLMDRFTQQTFAGSQSVAELRVAWSDVQRLERDLVLHQEKPSDLPAVESQWSAAIARVDKQAAVLSGGDGAIAAMGRDLASAIRSYQRAAEPVVAQIKAGGMATPMAARDQMAAAVKESAAQTDKLSVQLADSVSQAADALRAEKDQTQAQALKMFAVVVALAMLIVAPSTWLNMLSICQPIERAQGMAQAIASGNLTLALGRDAAGQDEVAALVRAQQEMQTSISGIVRNVHEAAENIRSASDDIFQGNKDLSARTEHAASSLAETASSMEQLTATVKQSTDAARQANQLASTAADVAARGGQVVSQVVTTMEDINHSSKKIADIIGVIDGIAFQTNILALNAAVEAARAGEQGRGFAVVAGEVRNLAQRSAQAAKEIKDLIGASVDKVQAGTQLVQSAGQTMGEIVASVQRVTDIIAEITAAAGEQSDGISQVNVAVNQLDQLTQQNAALVEQSTAAAESLKDQAQRLTQAVGVFKIDGVVQTHHQSRALSAPPAAPAPARRAQAALPQPKAHAPAAARLPKPTVATPPSASPAPARSASKVASKPMATPAPSRAAAAAPAASKPAAAATAKPSPAPKAEPLRRPAPAATAKSAPAGGSQKIAKGGASGADDGDWETF